MLTKTESTKVGSTPWNTEAVNGYLKSRFKPEQIRNLYLLIRVVYPEGEDPILQKETLVLGNDCIFLFEDRTRKKNTAVTEIHLFDVDRVHYSRKNMKLETQVGMFEFRTDESKAIASNIYHARLKIGGYWPGIRIRHSEPPFESIPQWTPTIKTQHIIETFAVWCAKASENPYGLLGNYVIRLDLTNCRDFDFAVASWADYKDFSLILSSFQYDNFLRGILLRDVDGCVLDPCAKVVRTHRQLRKLVMNNVTNCALGELNNFFQSFELTTNANMEIFDFQNCIMSEANLAPFYAYLRKSKCLSYLNLSGCQLGPELIQNLFRALQYNESVSATLKKLNVSSNNFGMTEDETMASSNAMRIWIIKNAKDMILENLSIASTNCAMKVCFEGIKFLKNISKIDFSNNHIMDDATVELMCSFFSMSEFLCDVNMENLTHSPLVSDPGKYIRYLWDKEYYVKLNLALNPLFATWCTNRFFYRCENLLDLDLSGLAFNEIQFKSVQQGLMEMKILQKLNLSNFYDKKVLSYHTSQANLQCIMLLILGSKCIRTLILKDIGPFFISSIFNEWGGVGSNISKLDISNNQLSITDIQAFAKFLVLNKSLKRVALDNNNLNYEGYYSIAVALHYNDTLEKLKWPSNDILRSFAASRNNAQRKNIIPSFGSLKSLSKKEEEKATKEKDKEANEYSESHKYSFTMPEALFRVQNRLKKYDDDAGFIFPSDYDLSLYPPNSAGVPIEAPVPSPAPRPNLEASPDRKHLKFKLRLVRSDPFSTQPSPAPKLSNSQADTRPKILYKAQELGAGYVPMTQMSAHMMPSMTPMPTQQASLGSMPSMTAYPSAAHANYPKINAPTQLRPAGLSGSGSSPLAGKSSLKPDSQLQKLRQEEVRLQELRKLEDEIEAEMQREIALQKKLAEEEQLAQLVLKQQQKLKEQQQREAMMAQLKAVSRPMAAIAMLGKSDHSDGTDSSNQAADASPNPAPAPKTRVSFASTPYGPSESVPTASSTQRASLPHWKNEAMKRKSNEKASQAHVSFHDRNSASYSQNRMSGAPSCEPYRSSVGKLPTDGARVSTSLSQQVLVQQQRSSQSSMQPLPFSMLIPSSPLLLASSGDRASMEYKRAMLNKTASPYSVAFEESPEAATADGSSKMQNRFPLVRKAARMNVAPIGERVAASETTGSGHGPRWGGGHVRPVIGMQVARAEGSSGLSSPNSGLSPRSNAELVQSVQEMNKLQSRPNPNPPTPSPAPTPCASIPSSPFQSIDKRRRPSHPSTANVPPSVPPLIASPRVDRPPHVQPLVMGKERRVSASNLAHNVSGPSTSPRSNANPSGSLSSNPATAQPSSSVDPSTHASASFQFLASPRKTTRDSQVRPEIRNATITSESSNPASNSSGVNSNPRDPALCGNSPPVQSPLVSPINSPRENLILTRSSKRRPMVRENSRGELRSVVNSSTEDREANASEAKESEASEPVNAYVPRRSRSRPNPSTLSKAGDPSATSNGSTPLPSPLASRERERTEHLAHVWSLPRDISIPLSQSQPLHSQQDRGPNSPPNAVNSNGGNSGGSSPHTNNGTPSNLSHNSNNNNATPVNPPQSPLSQSTPSFPVSRTVHKVIVPANNSPAPLHSPSSQPPNALLSNPKTRLISSADQAVPAPQPSNVPVQPSVHMMANPRNPMTPSNATPRKISGGNPYAQSILPKPQPQPPTQTQPALSSSQPQSLSNSQSGLQQNIPSPTAPVLARSTETLKVVKVVSHGPSIQPGSRPPLSTSQPLPVKPAQSTIPVPNVNNTANQPQHQKQLQQQLLLLQQQQEKLQQQQAQIAQQQQQIQQQQILLARPKPQPQPNVHQPTLNPTSPNPSLPFPQQLARPSHGPTVQRPPHVAVYRPPTPQQPKQPNNEQSPNSYGNS